MNAELAKQALLIHFLHNSIKCFKFCMFFIAISAYKSELNLIKLNSDRAKKNHFIRSFFLRHAQGTPSWFWNDLDWRALVKSHPPYIGKLKEYNFLRCKFFFIYHFYYFFKNWLLIFFQIFLDFFSLRIWLNWRALVKLRIPNI